MCNKMLSSNDASVFVLVLGYRLPAIIIAIYLTLKLCNCPLMHIICYAGNAPEVRTEHKDCHNYEYPLP